LLIRNLKYSPPLMTKNSCRKLFKQEVMGGIPLTSLTPPHFLSVPNQNRFLLVTVIILPVFKGLSLTRGKSMFLETTELYSLHV